MTRLAQRIQMRIQTISRDKSARARARERAARRRSARGVWAAIRGALRLERVALGGTAKVHPAPSRTRTSDRTATRSRTLATALSRRSTSTRKRRARRPSQGGGADAFGELALDGLESAPIAGQLSFLDESDDEDGAGHGGGGCSVDDSDAASEGEQNAAEESRLMAVASRFLSIAAGRAPAVPARPGATAERPSTAQARGAALSLCCGLPAAYAAVPAEVACALAIACPLPSTTREPAILRQQLVTCLCGRNSRALAHAAAALPAVQMLWKVVEEKRNSDVTFAAPSGRNATSASTTGLLGSKRVRPWSAQGAGARAPGARHAGTAHFSSSGQARGNAESPVGRSEEQQPSERDVSEPWPQEARPPPPANAEDAAAAAERERVWAAMAVPAAPNNRWQQLIVPHLLGEYWTPPLPPPPPPPPTLERQGTPSDRPGTAQSALSLSNLGLPPVRDPRHGGAAGLAASGASRDAPQQRKSMLRSIRIPARDPSAASASRASLQHDVDAELQSYIREAIASSGKLDMLQQQVEATPAAQAALSPRSGTQPPAPRPRPRLIAAARPDASALHAQVLLAKCCSRMRSCHYRVACPVHCGGTSVSMACIAAVHTRGTQNCDP